MSEGRRFSWSRLIGRREEPAKGGEGSAAGEIEREEVVERGVTDRGEGAAAEPSAPPAATPVAPPAATPVAPPAAAPAPAAPAGAEEQQQRVGWFRRLRDGLSRSSTALKESIGGIITKRRLDHETLEELEDALIAADLGVETARELVAELGRTRFGREVTDEEVRGALAEQIATILTPVAWPLKLDPAHRPSVILVSGVNGTGKTTTIGKLAHQLRGEGKGVVLAAGDTFRAAAIEQLQVWGERTGCPVVSRPTGADSAGLAYDALERARREGADVLIVDTAGRLHNKAALMDELAKVVRVLRKLDPEAPQHGLLVLDATTGQNAHNQVETFRNTVPVTGLIVTKLDGSARGGVVVALARRFGLPIHAVGVGESVDDLRPFEARAFARALLGLDPA